MSEIVFLENAPTGPDHRQLAQLWFADNRLRVSAGQLGFRSAEVYERNIRRWLYWMETEDIRLIDHRQRANIVAETVDIASLGCIVNPALSEFV